MKIGILLLSSAFTVTAFAQKSSPMFSVTDQTKGGANWSVIRATDADGEKLLMNNVLAKGTAIDAGLLQKKAAFGPGLNNFADQPMYSGVAGLAYDEQNNRLYFTTMFTQELRYINLSDPSGNYYQVASLGTLSKNKVAITPEHQGPVITRMTIGADNYGYALSNDGEQLYRFSLGKNTDVTVLGSLVDDEKNGSVSVHNQCSSWGGDIVAAANGDLYLFTMSRLVFKINPANRIATLLGNVEGLDANFTINGAAVDNDGNVVLSTAAFPGTRGIIKDMSTLKASQEKSESYFNTSDLASSNLLFGKKIMTKTPQVVFENNSDALVSIYPNPAVDGFTVLQFNKKVFGPVNIDLLNGSGANMMRKPVQVNVEGQQVRLSTSKLAKGLYVVKVVDVNKKEIYNSKLLVQ